MATNDIEWTAYLSIYISVLENWSIVVPCLELGFIQVTNLIKTDNLNEDFEIILQYTVS